MSAPETPDRLVERLLAAAAARRGPTGAPIDAGVLVVEDSEAVLRWANSTMTTNGESVGRTVTVIALVPLARGTGSGTVSAPATVAPGAEGDAALAALLDAAVAAAVRGGPARDAADLPVPGRAAPDFAAPAEHTSTAVFTDLAPALADSFRAGGDERSFGFLEHRRATTWLGTSAGVRRRWSTPVGSLELNLKEPRTGASAWGGQGTRDFSDLGPDALGGLVTDLRTRLGWGTRRVALPAGRYETLLPPSATSDLMIYLAWSMGGRPAQEGRSALSRAGGTRVGERLTDLPLTLAGDPAAPGFPALAHEPVLAVTRSDDEVSVFDTGAPTRRVEWLRGGRIHELAYPRAAAREFATDGARFAPPADNLLLTGGDAGVSTADMVAATRRGLLLTCLWYIREVDPTTMLLTGLTRDGVYLVEDGEVVGEVNNFRFNESPLDLVRRVTAAGATERTLPREWKDWFTRAAMPTLRVPDFTMSSTSQAS